VRLPALLVTAGLATAALSPAAFADRWPTSSERAEITRILTVNGFSSWGEIERDDGKWEVDDAVHSSGRVYDIDIRRGRIVKWDRD